MTRELMYSWLLDNEICSADFLSGAITVGGFNTETLERCLYYKTGYTSFDTWLEDEVLNEEA